jgi:hypothetical protein
LKIGSLAGNYFLNFFLRQESLVAGYGAKICGLTPAQPHAKIEVLPRGGFTPSTPSSHTSAILCEHRNHAGAISSSQILESIDTMSMLGHVNSYQIFLYKQSPINNWPREPEVH